MKSVQLFLGDCLDSLKQLDDNSVDSVVTDPPYGLSPSGGNNRTSINDVLLDVVFPELAEFYSSFLEDGNLSIPRGSILYLDWVLRTIGIEANITMPEGSIDFNGKVSIRDKEVEDTTKPTSIVSDGVLVNETDIQSPQLISDFVFNLRPLGYSSFNNHFTCSVREQGSGLFSVPVVVSPNSGFSRLFSSEFLRQCPLLSDFIRSSHNTFDNSVSSASDTTGVTTEVVVMLTLDLPTGSCEFTPAVGTSEIDFIGEFLPLEFFATGKTTSKLPSMFKSICISGIKGITNRTLSFYFHSAFISQVSQRYLGGFMGKKWDYDVPSKEIWEECLRVLKPGGYLLSFSGSRTYHRVAVNIEDAGFEIRDQIMWVYAQGFPKSQNVIKSIIKNIKCQLKENAPLVVQVSAPIQVKSKGDTEHIALAPALILPEERKGLLMETGKGVAFVEATDTSVSTLMEIMFSNIDTSWKSIWGDASKVLSKFTTSTKTNLIIDLKTWNSLQSLSTQNIIVKDATSPSGLSVSVETAESSLTEEEKKLKHIPILTVLGTAIANPLLSSNGTGTALKPAHEPIVMARKPFKGSVASNVLKWGTGGLNIDDCRVTSGDNPMSWSSPKGGIWKTDKNAIAEYEENTAGRFPANFIHDGSDEVVSQFPDSNGSGGSTPNVKITGYGDGIGNGETNYYGGERKKHDAGSGSAARFFYCAKANKKDRNEGMPEEIPVFSGRPRREDGSVIYREDNPEEWAAAMQKRSRKDSTALAGAEEKLQGMGNGLMNTHPTVKPTELMAYLCRLVTRPGGVVLDPFMGSGSTGKAAVLNGYEFIGCEMSEEYLTIAKTRIEYAQSSEYTSKKVTPKKETKKKEKSEKKTTKAFSTLESFFN